MYEMNSGGGGVAAALRKNTAQCKRTQEEEDVRDDKWKLKSPLLTHLIFSYICAVNLLKYAHFIMKLLV